MNSTDDFDARLGFSPLERDDGPPPTLAWIEGEYTDGPSMKSPDDWVCPECGSDKIEGTAWISVNTGEVLPSDPPLDYYWCPDHGDHVNRLWTRSMWDLRHKAGEGAP